MKTQVEAARSKILTPAMRIAAGEEGVSPDLVIEKIASGKAVLPYNPVHSPERSTVVGSSFRTKVNANIGCSSERSSIEEEKCKLAATISAGADFVMDLSVGKNIREVRKAIIEASSLPIGTVPIYEALSRCGEDVRRFDGGKLLEVIEEQAREGVDFMTLHAGLLREHVSLAVRRKMGIVSRGGAILAQWMTHRKAQNPLYDRWDEVLDICKANDVTISLGDGLRPGCLADASDEAQFAELEVLGSLVSACRKAGVQVMVEGPGHIPFDQIQMNIERQRDVCDGAPFYVLGPVVTDIAPGYDHITACIGATAAAYYGASLLCYVTPAEHLGLPTLEDVRKGIVAFRIAAHAADVAKGLPGARSKDDEMAEARMSFDWPRQFALAMDPEEARTRHEQARSADDADRDHCSMCGREFCAIRTTKAIRDANECGKATIAGVEA